MPRSQSAIVVSFSGIDGAGKSTQIKSLFSLLNEAGIRVKLLAFWDDVAVLKGVRESSSHALFNSEKGVGVPGKPVSRRDKNVTTWYMTQVRFVLYFLDALWLRTIVSRVLKQNLEVAIFDRYLFDELANLNLGNPFTRSFVRFLLSLSPKPDVAFLLDAEPVHARERKPEYPLDFIVANRASYLALSQLSGMTVVGAGSVEEVKRRVVEEIVSKLSPQQAAAISIRQVARLE